MRKHIYEVSLRGMKRKFGTNTYLGSLTSRGETSEKNFFEDEERLRKRRENSEKKDLGQIHIYEVSLRGRRETSEEKRDFGDGETSKTKRDFGDGEKTREKLILKQRQV